MKPNNSEITLEDLGRMVQAGFEQVDNHLTELGKRFDAIERRLDRIEERLDRIEKVLLERHEERIKRLEDSLNL